MRVTCFVITIGKPVAKRCLAALAESTTPHKLDVIENVSPLAAAYNEMLVRCKTELFVQIDEDMILAPTAVAKLVAAIDASGPEHVMACLPLWDVDLEQPIHGLKIYRHGLAQRHPFQHSADGDRRDRDVWEAAGLTWSAAKLKPGNCVGEHGTEYTPEELFIRWRRLWQKHRHTGRVKWIEKWPKRLADRYERTQTRRDLYALIGAVTGATEEPWSDDRGPDFRREDPVLARLVALLPPR